jgi:hypothetical protein
VLYFDQPPMPVVMYTGQVRHVLQEPETELLLTEFDQVGRVGRDPEAADRAAKKIRNAHIQDKPPFEPVRLTRPEMAATRHALQEIGREIGMSGTREAMNFARLSRGIRLEMESAP